MKKIKTGVFTVTLDLGKGREYQFRYLLDKKLGKMKNAENNLHWQSNIQCF